jgi:hypothetical protein
MIASPPGLAAGAPTPFAGVDLRVKPRDAA